MAVRFYEPQRVALRWARPNDGYEVEVRKDGPDQVVVLFRARGHRSRVRAYYDNGAASQEVKELSGESGQTGQTGQSTGGRTGDQQVSGSRRSSWQDGRR